MSSLRNRGDGDAIPTGAKRKRNDSENPLQDESGEKLLSMYISALSQSSLDAAVKKRSIASSSDSSFASLSNSTSLTTENTAAIPLFSSKPQPCPPPSRIPRPIQRTHLGETPSLCSDNDGIISQDDAPPSTPPEENRPSFRDYEVPIRGESVNPDVDMDDEREESLSASRPATPYKPKPSVDVFAKRPPVSPLPAPSPRKPRPPYRPSRPPPAPPSPEETSEDPLALRPSQSENDPVRRPASRQPGKDMFLAQVAQAKKLQEHSRRSSVASTSVASQSRASSISRTSQRRLTLDEELWEADKRSLLAQADGDEEDNLESEIFVGVGTRSKTQGFLAHGGAGGPPVFMGVGYVEGAEEEESGHLRNEVQSRRDADGTSDEPSPSRRKKKPAKKRKGKR